MCPAVRTPVGPSSDPAVTLTVVRSGARQNRLEPHSAQNPRSAPVSLAGLGTKRRPRASTSSSDARGTEV
jgi:hypothetical protein